uniref:Uncharacterized protein n=1 Tax=Myotis myotis TaxID=51298 RepID=A0A7J7XHL5_MYOMY|nr:hypothetical protein mMyoMyo1_011749 [Myotis myotis]
MNFVCVCVCVCIGAWEGPLKLNPSPGLYNLYDFSHCPHAGSRISCWLLTPIGYSHPPCGSSASPETRVPLLIPSIASPSQTPNPSLSTCIITSAKTTSPISPPLGWPHQSFPKSSLITALPCSEIPYGSPLPSL